MYVADTGNYVIRVMNLATNTTAVAVGRSIGSRDGAANATGGALLSGPRGLFLSNTQLYWADSDNNLVRQVSLNTATKLPTGQTSRVVGRNVEFRDGALSTATLGDPQGVAISPSGDIFIAGKLSAVFHEVALIRHVLLTCWSHNQIHSTLSCL